MNGVPTSVYDVSPVRNTGWLTGGAPYWSRSPNSTLADGKAVYEAKCGRLVSDMKQR